MDQQGIERYSTEIKAQSMQMLGGSSYGEQQSYQGQYQPPQQRPIGTQSSLYQPMPPHNTHEQPKAITPPSVADDDMPF